MNISVIVTRMSLEYYDRTQVPPIHYELIEGGVVATPDVNGVAQALDTIYDDLQKDSNSREIVTESKVQEAKDWIENHFTKDKVVNAFLYLLRDAKRPSRSKHPQVSFVCDMMDLPDAPWVLVYVSITLLEVHSNWFVRT